MDKNTIFPFSFFLSRMYCVCVPLRGRKLHGRHVVQCVSVVWALETAHPLPGSLNYSSGSLCLLNDLSLQPIASHLCMQHIISL